MTELRWMKTGPLDHLHNLLLLLLFLVCVFSQKFVEKFSLPENSFIHCQIVRFMNVYSVNITEFRLIQYATGDQKEQSICI